MGAKLEAYIKRLVDSVPGAMYWKSFGFASDWHEKGFTVAASRDSIISLAKRYRQGAIYRFHRSQVHVSGCSTPLVKETVPALLDNTDAAVPMLPVSQPATLPTSRPDWAPSS